jgi:hypothetical protein
VYVPDAFTAKGSEILLFAVAESSIANAPAPSFHLNSYLFAVCAIAQVKTGALPNVGIAIDEVSPIQAGEPGEGVGLGLDGGLEGGGVEVPQTEEPQVFCLT